MIYSCGYLAAGRNPGRGPGAQTRPDRTQVAIEPGMKVLDIGCGWGGALHYFAEKYGVTGVGVTISRDQYETARQRCMGQPLKSACRTTASSAGDSTGFVPSACSNTSATRTTARTWKSCAGGLEPDRCFCCTPSAAYRSLPKTDAWNPQVHLPHRPVAVAKTDRRCRGRVSAAGRLAQFPTGLYRTLMCWHENFVAAWDEFKADYDERFYRM